MKCLYLGMGWDGPRASMRFPNVGNSTNRKNNRGFIRKKRKIRQRFEVSLISFTLWCLRKLEPVGRCLYRFIRVTSRCCSTCSKCPRGVTCCCTRVRTTRPAWTRAATSGARSSPSLSVGVWLLCATSPTKGFLRSLS